MTNVEQVGILGAGTMGKRIALSCLAYRKTVRLFESDINVRNRTFETVQSLFANNAEKVGTHPAAVRALMRSLSISPSLEACVAGADLIIETVPENVELKRRVIQDISRWTGPNTLICTNSSSIPGSWLVGSVAHPANFFNLNFGSIDDIKVELMGHDRTSPETLRAARHFLRSLHLIPIQLSAENMGFAMNRIWRVIKKETLSILQRRILTCEELDRAWMLEWNTEMGPCGLMDQVGLDVVSDIEMVYFQASGDESDRPPQLLGDLIAQGKLGVKSGEGFYHYPNPVYRNPGWLYGEDS